MPRSRAASAALALLLAGSLGGLGWGLSPRPLPDLDPGPLPPIEDADAWVAARVAADQALGVWPVGTWRLHRSTPGRAPVAFVYVHGFGATRAEGEATVDPLVEQWGANALYVRLPGHALDAEAHAAATPEQYARTVAEALQVGHLLGDKVVLVGSSTGGLLATWAAATYPEAVDALVLTSPFYELADPVGRLLLPRRMALPVMHALYGEVRDAGWGDDPEGRKVDGYDDRWLVQQQYDALVPLEDLRRAVARPQVYGAVAAPTLLLCYYADEQHQDSVVRVSAMREAFAAFAGGRPDPRSRLVEVADGNHILTSAWVRTDKQAVRAAMEAFLADSVGPPPAP